MTRYYIGIDGGGSKTDAVLFRSDGELVQRVIGAGTNPNHTDQADLAERFQTIFQKLLIRIRPTEISGCFAGLSGSDHPLARRQLIECIRPSCPVPITHLQVGVDALNALWSGTDGEPGLVVIAGTGSIAYGIAANGDEFRIGGWGYQFGDEGSGYDIGRETVRRVLMTFDGRQRETQLTQVVMRYFHVDTISDIVPYIYRAPKKKIAGLVPFVEKSALHGDRPAADILERAAQSLTVLIENGRRRIADGAPIVLAGGVWHSSVIRRYVFAHSPYPYLFPECPPVYGSMAKCLYEWGEPPIRAALKKIRKNLSGG